MPITVEKARVNLWNLLSFFIGIAVTSFGWGITYNQMTNNAENAKTEIAELSKTVNSIQEQMPEIRQLQFQVGRTGELIADNRANISATNARIDRIAESLTTKLDTVIETVNKIATRVEVIATRVQQDNPQRTNYERVSQ